MRVLKFKTLGNNYVYVIDSTTVSQFSSKGWEPVAKTKRNNVNTESVLRSKLTLLIGHKTTAGRKVTGCEMCTIISFTKRKFGEDKLV